MFKRKRVSFEGKINPQFLPKGVQIEGKDLVFSGYDDDTVKQICKRMSGLVSETKRTQYKPTDEDRQKVADIVAEGLDVSDFGIYRAVVSSTQKDTDRDKFSQAVLEEMGKQYKDGRPVVLGHTMFSPVGKTFDYEVVQNGVEFELYVKFFILPEAKSETDVSVKTLLDTRSLDRFSIGGYLKILEVVRDESTGARTYFYDHEDAVIAHLGIVDMGANTDAVAKSASGSGISFGEIQNTVTMFKKTYKHLGNLSVDLTEDAIGKALDVAEDKIEKMSKRLEKLDKYEKAEAESLKVKQDKWASLKKQLNDDEDAEKLERRAGLFTADSLDLLSEEIESMQKQLSEKKKNLKLDPKQGDKDDKKTKRKFQAL